MTTTRNGFLVPRPALFLDRDGVINRDTGYVYRKQDFVFIDGIFDVVTAASQAGYLCIVVTNQSGIGRGLYTKEDFVTLMRWVRAEFWRRRGNLDAIYFCPHHPIYGRGRYRVDCLGRKPNPGMIEAAMHDHDIDITRSFFVGDKRSDMVAAQCAGIANRVLLASDEEAPEATHLVKSPRDLVPLLVSTALTNR